MDKETTRGEEILEFITTIKEMIERNNKDSEIINLIENKICRSMIVPSYAFSKNRDLYEELKKCLQTARSILCSTRGE